MGDDGSGSESGSKVGKLIKWKKTKHGGWGAHSE